MRPDLRARAPAFAVLIVIGGVSVYALGRAGGTAAALLGVLATACALALAARLQPDTLDSRLVEQLSDWALLALPGLLVLYISFNSGGFFPQTAGFAAAALVVLLILRTTLTEQPFAGFSAPLAVA